MPVVVLQSRLAGTALMFICGISFTKRPFGIGILAPSSDFNSALVWPVKAFTSRVYDTKPNAAFSLCALISFRFCAKICSL